MISPRFTTHSYIHYQHIDVLHALFRDCLNIKHSWTAVNRRYCFFFNQDFRICLQTSNNDPTYLYDIVAILYHTISGFMGISSDFFNPYGGYLLTNHDTQPHCKSVEVAFSATIWALGNDWSMALAILVPHRQIRHFQFRPKDSFFVPRSVWKKN